MIRVEAARDMLAAVEARAAGRYRDLRRRGRRLARRRIRRQKLKKDGNGVPPLQLVENPDILATIAQRQHGRRRW
ncbi:MAG: hypothetical protein MZV49_20850 [Rhodopseudomonas palustris]|nr:hypothetical protein [Rhodopseudomonas palustris]